MPSRVRTIAKPRPAARKQTTPAPSFTLASRSKPRGPAPILIRDMRLEDARAFLEIHHAAVHGLAPKDYSPDVIDAWAPMPILDEHVEKVRSNPDREMRLIAERDGRIVGIGCLIAGNGELRACYVSPEASRRGVGSAIVGAIELAAREQGVAHLDGQSPPNHFTPCWVMRRASAASTSCRTDCAGLRQDAQAP